MTPDIEDDGFVTVVPDVRALGAVPQAPDDIKALVPRLRTAKRDEQCNDSLCDEAADAIDYLRADLTAAKECIALLEDDQARNEAEIARLQALIRAAYEDAAQAVEKRSVEIGRAECCGFGVGGYTSPPECCGDPDYIISNVVAAATIRALTPADARRALDERDRAAEARGMRMAAEIATGFDGAGIPTAFFWPHEIGRAILDRANQHEAGLDHPQAQDTAAEKRRKHMAVMDDKRTQEANHE